MMADTTAFKRNRFTKQMIMGFVFVAILIGGWFLPWLGLFIPACMLAGIGTGFFRGRAWCSWVCPRGSFYDSMTPPLSPQKPIPEFMKRPAFRWLMVGLLLGLVSYNVAVRWPDFRAIAHFFVVMMTATTVLGVILALLIAPRTWCTFCPIGTMVKQVGARKYPLTIDPSACIDCKLCAKSCPMQIKPYAFKESRGRIVGDGDCLKCRSCISVCPRKALKL